MQKYLYTRQGYLVPLIAIAAYVIVRVGIGIIYNDPTFFEENLTPRFLASIAIGLSLWFLGKKLNPVSTDKKKKHDLNTFLMIRMEHWGPIIAILSIISYFK